MSIGVKGLWDVMRSTIARNAHISTMQPSTGHVSHGQLESITNDHIQ